MGISLYLADCTSTNCQTKEIQQRRFTPDDNFYVVDPSQEILTLEKLSNYFNNGKIVNDSIVYDYEYCNCSDNENSKCEDYKHRITLKPDCIFALDPNFKFGKIYRTNNNKNILNIHDIKFRLLSDYMSSILDPTKYKYHIRTNFMDLENGWISGEMLKLIVNELNEAKSKMIELDANKYNNNTLIKLCDDLQHVNDTSVLRTFLF